MAQGDRSRALRQIAYETDFAAALSADCMPLSFRIQSATDFRLGGYDSSDTRGLAERECHQITEKNRSRIAELQNVLYAERQRSLLIVLLAMDTGGKDPIIRDVLSAANPQACRVTAFRKATEEEETHDRFWRFHQMAPAKGEIGVFNRSYYDDIIRCDAHGDLDDESRLRHHAGIRHFERLLSDQEVTLAKLFLHISKQEQKTRLEERIADPQRHWELSESDFKERKYWDGYMKAFEAAIRNTHSPSAPWYVITSDRKWFRDAAASSVIIDALESMNPQFPPSKVDLDNIQWY